MSKTRTWPVKLTYILIAAALAISLIIVAAPAHKVSAANNLIATNTADSQWTKVLTPDTEDAVLAPGSTISDYAVASDGEVAYAIFYSAAMSSEDWPGPWFLAKSTDGAATWGDITKAVKKEIAKVLGLASADDVATGMFELGRVAADSADPTFLAIALSINGTTVHVFTSKDGGDTFKDSDKTGITGIANLGEIYDLAVSPAVDGDREVAMAGYHGSDSVLLRSTVTAGTASSWEDATAYVGWDNNGSTTATPFNSAKVTDIQFSPDWAQDKSILAVTIRSDLKTVDLQIGTWGETETEGWNSKSVAGIDALKVITAPAVLPSLGRWVAGITLPSDYTAKTASKRYAWLWVNYGTTASPEATIFLVKNNKAEKVGPKGQIEDEELWLTDVSYLGTIDSGKAIAGALGDGAGGNAVCCNGVRVFRNNHITSMDICCFAWEEACKPPTGRYAMDAFYINADKAYAVALGPDAAYDESAWSVSFDDGDTWNQLSLIDTYIDYLSDVAKSPDCNKTMLVSVNLNHGCGCDSVWVYAKNFPEEEGYNEYSGHWLRTWCGQLGADQYGLLRLAPEETDGMTVYLVDHGTSTAYWNEEETLACWNTGSATKITSIVDLAVKDKSTIYALGSDGYVGMADDYARGWHTTVDSKVGKGWTIAVHGDDILVGGQDGDVSHSDDGGQTFALLKDESGTAVMTPIPGYVTVAFDSYFDTNAIIYAATIAECPDVEGGVYRWVMGESTAWKDLNARHDFGYTGLVLSYPNGNTHTGADTGGVLYASYVGHVHNSDWSQADDWFDCWKNESKDWDTGVARCLTPAGEILCEKCIEWDYLTVGLKGSEYFIMMPQALKACGCMDPSTNTELFAIGAEFVNGNPYYDMSKAQHGTVWTFEDCYAKKAPELTSANNQTIPADCYCSNLPFSIKWDDVCDACYYDVQIALDDQFTDVVATADYKEGGKDILGATGPSYVVPNILTCQVTYYWRVRAHQAQTCQIIHSWWSDAGTFTVAPSADQGAIDLIAPVSGATDVGTKNVGFSWNLQASANKFDWVLSKNADLSSPVESKPGLTNRAYTCTVTLDHGTTYYWHVYAYQGSTLVSSSAVGTFTTGPTGPFCSAIDGRCFETEQELIAHNADLEKPAGTPFWVWVVIGIGAVLVIVVIVLIFRTRRV